MWDHLEHFEPAKGGPLACPRLDGEGMVLDNTGCSKAHASRAHGSSFRVKIKLVSRGRQGVLKHLPDLGSFLHRRTRCGRRLCATMSEAEDRLDKVTGQGI